MVRAALLVLVLALSACATTRTAPVQDRSVPVEPVVARTAAPKPASKPAKLRDWRPDSHTVQKGDTLYSIALEYGLDYRELAAWNDLADINLIRVGQSLRLVPTQNGGAAMDRKPAQAGTQSLPLRTEVVPQPKPISEAPLITQPKAVKLPYSDAVLAQLERGPVAPPAKPEPAAAAVKPDSALARPVAAVEKAQADAAPREANETEDVALEWIWPSNGRVIAEFSEARNSKGLDIAGKAGQPVYAAAPGKVVYSGAGLRGYGRLVIIKHNPIYLSAYAHNQQVLVKEGQIVTRGQKIAEMGDSDADQVKLHFQIRQMGKPVDPLKYLPEAQK